MSAVSLQPLHGAVSLGTAAYVADYNAFTLRAAQGVEGVTPFGANTCSKNVGAGTPDFAFSVSAAALAHASATAPGLPGGAGMFVPNGFGGATSTFTLDTGVTEACTMVVADYTTGVARMRAAVPVGITGKNYSDVTEVWAVS